MRTAILAAALLLAACATQPSGPGACLTEGKPFIEAWPCLRGKAVAIRGYDDIRATYIATGDYTAEEVRGGRMSDAQAKMVMARARQSAIEAANVRDSDPAGDIMALGYLGAFRRR